MRHRPTTPHSPLVIAAAALSAVAIACSPSTSVAPTPVDPGAVGEDPDVDPPVVNGPAGEQPGEEPGGDGSGGEGPDGEGPAVDRPAEGPTEPIAAPVVIDWSDRPGPTALGDGWVVMGCEGDAPMLCVERDGTFVGIVELMVMDAGVPAGTSDEEVLAELEGRVEDFLATFRQDRGQSCSELSFVGESATPADFGEGVGVRYGFLLRRPEGPVVERTMGHMAIADGKLAVLAINAATAEGCVVDEMTGFTPDQLASFQPHLARLAAGSTNWSGV